jgi:hypothetical protein
MRGATVPIPNHFSMGLKQILAAMLAVDPRQAWYIPSKFNYDDSSILLWVYTSMSSKIENNSFTELCI